MPTFSEKLLDDLVRDECRNGQPELKPYYDTATPPRITIGIGHNLTDKGLSKAAVYFIYHEDIEEVFGALDHSLKWWRNLNEDRQRVLANMCFNLGISKLLTFKGTLVLIQTGHYVDAAKHMMNSLWARQVGPRAERLADLMDPTGEYKK